MRIMIYFSFSTDSIIPWIASLNKCSLFCFYAIYLPPAEEGEFLLYYVKNVHYKRINMAGTTYNITKGLKHIRRGCMENEEYKKEISEMLNEMENNKILKLIYNFVKSGYKEEKQGN